MRRSPSWLRERHFLAEADLCVHILSMLNTRGTETRLTPLILAVSEMSAMPERCAYFAAEVKSGQLGRIRVRAMN